MEFRNLATLNSVKRMLKIFDLSTSSHRILKRIVSGVSLNHGSHSLLHARFPVGTDLLEV